MSEKRSILIILAEKKEIKYSVSSIKKSNQERIDRIWDEVQKERLGETNELIAYTFVGKLCDILESTNIIESGKETSNKLKERKAFMFDVKCIASYFSSLIPYIGMVEGGIALRRDVYEHSKNPRVEENKNEASYTTDERFDESPYDEADPPE